jgi:para-nitrobenzyl esterase
VAPSLERNIAGLGALRGAVNGKVATFHAVPCAAPPTGALRFAAPAPAIPWTGVRDATRQGPIAPQTASRVDAVMGAITAPQDEDCLTLTICTPTEAGAKAPVMVWLHGGGFLTGAGSLPWYDGSPLAARHGVVVVGVNYRLGALGFLALPGLLPGNLAILDQAAALRWVQSHIAAFGGDPGNVTVVGQSGGAHNIASLLATSGTEGLFRRAILQSPPLSIGLSSAEDATRRGGTFLKYLGLDPATPNLLDRLRALPVKDLLEAQVKTAIELAAMAKGDLRPPFLPTDMAPHDFPGDHLLERAAKNVASSGVDVLIGWTRDEANLWFAGNPMLAALSEEQLGALAVAMGGDLEAAQRNRPGASPGQLFLELVTETGFGAPSRRMAARIMQAGGRAFVYRFDRQSPDAALGACHCLDIPFALGTWPAWTNAKLLGGADEASVERLSADMMPRWAEFAAHGDPGFAPWRGDAQPIHYFA